MLLAKFDGKRATSGAGFFRHGRRRATQRNPVAAPFPAAGLAGGVVAHNSAAIDLTAPSAFETNTLVAPAIATDGALLLTPSNALSDFAPSPVAAALPSAVSRPTLIVTRRLTGYERFTKPVIDRVLALVLLVALSPILLVVGVLVAVSLGWPIVLRQRRIGRDGEPFVLHKFRSMHPDRRRVGATYHGDRPARDPQAPRRSAADVGRPHDPEVEPRRASATVGRAAREARVSSVPGRSWRASSPTTSRGSTPATR